MKKTILLALVVALFSSLTLSPSNTNAQEIKYRVNGELAMPMGDFGDFAGTGFGVTASGEKKLDDKMTVTATIGYLMWGGEDFNLGFGVTGTTDFSAIPIQAGVKYFLMPKTDGLRAYGMGEAGFHYFMASAEVKGGGLDSSEDTSEIEFSLAPSVGFEMPLSDLTLDVAARYQYVSGDVSYFGIRAGVIF